MFYIYPMKGNNIINKLSSVLDINHDYKRSVFCFFLQMWDMWLSVSAAGIAQLAHEETHVWSALQLHLRTLRQTLRKTRQRQIPQAQEPSGQTAQLNQAKGGIQGHAYVKQTVFLFLGTFKCAFMVNLFVKKKNGIWKMLDE